MEDIMSRISKFFLSILLSISLILLSIPSQTVSAFPTDSIAFVILSRYDAVANIGDEINLIAVSTNGKQVTWKSSDSKIASVNTYGTVTAKKAGRAIITAKVKNAEASCQITVNKTKVVINKTSASIERDETLKLSATTSNGSIVTWKSSKSSIATIDENGTVTGIKPGKTTITVKADGTTATCIITVKSPTVKLDKTKVKLYRNQTVKLNATVSSKVNPTWKSNKKSVAIVDETGTVTAIKNGTAIITATVDGVSKTCEITVTKPDITLSSTELSLKKGEQKKLTATVSSGNLPVWTTSNSNIVSVNSNGEITALQKGTAYVYASEDGTKVRCVIKVTE
jgi:uncharacterized protein YjdB